MMNIKFIKLPKALFEGIYTELSSEGKLLYSLLLDRSLLSEKNSLTDDNGRVIVYFTNSEVCDKLKCSHDKATKLFRELECGKSALQSAEKPQEIILIIVILN